MNLTMEQADALKEILNIGAGQSADALNQIINHYVQIDISDVRAMVPDLLKNKFPEYHREHHHALLMRFEGIFCGTSAMLFTKEAGKVLVNVTTGITPEDKEYDTMRDATLTEIGNIVLNSLLGSIANLLYSQLDYKVPELETASLTELLTTNDRKQYEVLMAHTRLTVKGLDIENEMMICFDLDSFGKVIEGISQLSLEMYK